MCFRPAGAGIRGQSKRPLTGIGVRRCCALALAVLLPLLAARPLPAQNEPDFRSAAPLLDEVATLVERHVFADAVADRAVQAHAAAAAGLPAAPDDAAVDRAIDAFVAELGVSHLARFEPHQVAYYELLDIFSDVGFTELIRRVFPRGVVYDGIGIRLGNDADGLGPVITDVYDGGPGDRSGLLAGERLLSVRGAAATPVEAFLGQAGETVPLEVRGLDGGVRDVPVTVETIRPSRLFRESIAASARILPHDVGYDLGYLRILSWAGPRMHAAVAETVGPEGPLADADGLILDLRRGWGGARPSYTDLFFSAAPPTTAIARDGTRAVTPRRWNRPLVVLIGPGTRSGKEIVAYGLQQVGVPLVGARTAGAVLAARPFLLSDDSLLLIPVQDVVVDGRRLEGVGVEPDVPVDPGPPGEDRQLDAAVEILARMIAEGAEPL